MYTITFYSFKGGVGRTMAMANVALELARNGRRVLLVDFDLEAPGLDTFSVLKPPRQTPGLVDFVAEYQETGIAPNATKFAYQLTNLGLEGAVWVMPTGKRDEGYGSRLNSIDWQRLYAEQDGYLLFEDLKEQWAQAFNPDYVLIDSRTGHTDVGGICTRQLPNAVVLLFFPNEQNRRGLKVVVRDIRRESHESDRPIQLYFVAANVPDLDDEDRIIQERLREFRRTLQYNNLDATIHHYNSLSLLQQTVFTIERRRTKLAGEYVALAKRAISRNLRDRLVVMEFLEGLTHGGRGFSRNGNPSEIAEKLRQISVLYTEDGPVLYALGQANRALGREETAKQSFAKAEQLGVFGVDRLVERAAQEYSAGEEELLRPSMAGRALPATSSPPAITLSPARNKGTKTGR